MGTGGEARFWVAPRPSLIALLHITPIGTPPALLRAPPDSSGAPGHMRPPGPIGVSSCPPPGSRIRRRRHSRSLCAAAATAAAAATS